MSKKSEMGNLDLDNPKKNTFKIGKLTLDIIQLLNLNCIEKDIVLWRDRLAHLDKHKTDFENDEQYNQYIEAIPIIIQAPDYVGIHPNGNSIEYLKKMDKNILIAVRINNKKTLAFRTLYPISDTKLNNYISSGRLKKVKI